MDTTEMNDDQWNRVIEVNLNGVFMEQSMPSIILEKKEAASL